MIERFDWFARFGDLLDDPPANTGPGEFPRLDTDRLNDIASQVRGFYRLAYNREDSDCGVRALAVACAAPYEVAYAALENAGRKPGGPVKLAMLRAAAWELGYALIQEYAIPYGPTIRHCTYSMRDTKGGYIIVTCDHAAGVWNGEVIDWSRKRGFKVEGILRAKRVNTGKKLATLCKVATNAQTECAINGIRELEG
jgi:hypothetical protein